MSETHRIAASGWGGRPTVPKKMSSNRAAIITVLPLPVGAENEIACGFWLEACSRAMRTFSRIAK